MKKYSVIVPVYNRISEVVDLLDSLQKQTYKNFEIIIVEDGSTDKCDKVVEEYSDTLTIKYFFKENSGPGDSRNFGMEKAEGEYLIFFDSDCIIPPQYFTEVEKYLASNPVDAFGGPDSADESFSNVQKAINYSMTSIVTTGGVRGKENKLDTYQPRSFNMGISRAVYEKVGGYSDIHPGGDPDLSYRIMNAGFSIGLIEDAFVYHKRRIDFSKFVKQVYKFGVVRPILIKWYPDKFKITYTFPTVFLLGSLFLVLLSLTISSAFIFPLSLISIVFFVESFLKYKSLSISILSIFASFIQLYGYGYGFLRSGIKILILKQEERKVLKDFFFDEE